MNPTPHGVSDAAWRTVAQENVPSPGEDGRPVLRPVRDSVAPDLTCSTVGCGEALTGKGAKRDWILVRIVASGDPARGYCSAHCAARGIAHVQLGHHRTESAAPQPVARHRGNPNPPNNSRRNGERVAALGVTGSQIRAWAVATGVEVPARGALPTRVIDAYEAAHGGAA